MSIMDLQRKNFRGGGGQIGGTADMSGGSSTNQGPAGGASAGGNYGGNRNPDQTYGGSIFSGGNNNVGSSSTSKGPPKKPKPTKKNKVNEGFIKNYFNYHPVVSTLNKISKNKFNTNVNAKRREQYLNNLLETDPNEYNRVMSQLSKVNMIVGPKGITSQVPPSMGFTQTDYGMPSAPPGMLTSNFEEIDGRKSLGDPAALEILGQKYKDTLPTFGDGGGDGNPYILPQYAMMGGGADMGSEDVEEEKTYDYRFGDDQDVIYENYGTPGYRNTRAEGGIMGTRARRAMGGIMDRINKRQQFFLGGIGKAIKGAVGGVVDATKKVLKSDLGKAALFAAGTYYMGGGGNPFTKAGRGAFSFGNIPGAGYLMGGGKTPADNFNPLKVGAFGLGALALFGNKAKPNEDIGMADRGGRLKDSQGNDALPADIRAEIRSAYASGDSDRIKNIQSYYNFLPGADAVKLPSVQPYLPFPNYAEGGRIGKAEGGLMDLGGMEKDYRAEGGFVPIGEYEKKDDVPARLSVNEFVFTADAVRSAGQGDIDKGAEIMENMMENLENGGTVSEESQGNKGAQNMFSVSERIGEVI